MHNVLKVRNDYYLLEKKISSKLVIGSITLALVLLVNPNVAFAGVFPDIPACVGDSGPEAHLVDNIGGLTTLNVNVDTNPDPPEITFTETWTSSDRSYIIICGLDTQTTYKVIKIITNNSGDVWSNFDNELLDFAAYLNDNPNSVRLQGNDAFNDLVNYPDYVTVLDSDGPPFFSTSNNGDALDFEMGGAITRSSVTWDDNTADEDNFIDFVTFFDGILFNGQTEDQMVFGLESFEAQEQPFMLVQTPNIIRCPDPSQVFPDCMEVGGVFEEVDTTALLVAGAQMNAAWLIPLILGTIGIGIVVARKLKL